jgi:hypothetical protein
VKGKERSVEKVAKLVSGVPDTLDFFFGPLFREQPSVFRDCFGDGRVKATPAR